MFRPGPESKASMAKSVLTSSSTTRMFAVGSVFISNFRHLLLAKQPDAEERKQLFRIHGFRDVIGGGGREAFVAVAFHRLCSKGENRQSPMCAIFADRV